MQHKTKILFLCTGNSCRSQMAEGFARRLKGEVLEVFSAGTAPQPVNPHAAAVMAEIGIDISSQQSKHVDEFREHTFDFIITVCSDAHESCPLWLSRGKVIHKGFDDPPRSSACCSTLEETLLHYRRVRDEIRAYIESLPASLYTE